MNSVNWFDNNDSVDNKARSFIHKFDSLYNSCFPVKSKLVGIKRSRKPWLTPCLLKCITRKHYLYKRVKNSQCSFDYFKKYRNILDLSIRNSKRLYYEKKFNAAHNNIKSTCKILNNTLGVNKPNSNGIYLKQDNVLVKDNMIASTFNEHFINISKKIV